MEDDQLVESAPDPTETVRLLKSDFDLLQGAVNAAVDDVTALATLLGVEPRQGIPPYQVMREQLLPRVAMLVTTQKHVDQANREIQRAAARFGPGEINPETGRLEQKVGQRIPGGLTGLQPMSRRERREFERQQRRG